MAAANAISDQSMLRKPRSVYLLLGIGLFMAAAGIALVAGFAAERQNQASLETQTALAKFQADDVYDEMLGMLKRAAFNQDGYENISRHWNRQWIDHQLGDNLDAIGIAAMAVYGTDGDLHYARANHKIGRISQTDLATARGLKEILAVERATRVKAPSKLHTGIVIIGGRIFVAAAAGVAPQNLLDAPAAPELQHTLVFLKPLTIHYFEGLADGFDIRNLRLTRDASQGYARYALNDAAGKPLAWLEWEAQKPGDGMLNALLPFLFGMFVLLAVIQGTILHRWLKMQRALYISDANAMAAQQESHAKSVFLGTISHELRTPLNAIIGFSEVMTSQLFGPLGSVRYGEYAEHIKTSGLTLMQIVNDLIEIARIQRRDTALEREAIDVADCARRAMDEARSAAAAKRISLSLEGNAGNVWCIGSKLSFAQVLGRLLQYAVRYSFNDAKVTVGVNHSNQDIAVSITNQCQGIPPAELENINKLFLMSNDHLITNEYDTILGLVVADGLMKAMGGKFSIASTPGVGTTITLHLPRTEAPQTAKAAA